SMEEKKIIVTVERGNLLARLVYSENT
ncbi:unnamed protein product, partial [Rotaria sp. Silwood1]